uniref:Uncharacterized protein n=1 Tax=Anguilla anguilla TaxID=7936 RepID=A0A0E9RGN3_ANGAN
MFLVLPVVNELVRVLILFASLPLSRRWRRPLPL